MFSIAIDGPSASGKGTLAQGLKLKLGYPTLDTGAMYRAFAIFCKNNNILDESEIEKNLNKINISVKFIDGEQKTFLNNTLLGLELRQEEIGMLASKISGYKCVREKMVEIQRNIAKENNIIMEGRDIGTVVLPNANVKFFLTASVEERAKRRYKELLQKFNNANYDNVYQDLLKRDYNDIHKKISPLKTSKDTILIDNTSLSIEKMIDKCYNIAINKIHHSN